MHGTGVGRRISSGDRSVDPVRRLQVEGALRPLAVVVADVDAKDVLELAATEDEQPVEAPAADATDPTLNVSVRVRRLDRRADTVMSSLRKTSSKA